MLFLFATAIAGPLVDRSDLVIEGEVTDEYTRAHEVVEGLTVRVFTIEVENALKGTTGATVLFMAPGPTDDERLTGAPLSPSATT